MINIKQILTTFGIQYVESGKNISQKCVGVQCPNCNDTNGHCGVFLDAGNFTCWKCKAEGSLYQLVNHYHSISWKDFIKLFKKETLEDDVITQIEEILKQSKVEKVETKPKLIKFPPDKFCAPVELCLSKPLDIFLANRNFDKPSLVGCYYSWFGDWKFRLLIPIYFENKIVSFIGRDVTNKALNKYYNYPGVNIKNYLYNYDNVKQNCRIIIVEGIFDCWRLLPENVVASFGTSISREQFELIKQLKSTEIVLVWDNDAYWKATGIIQDLNLIAPSRLVHLPSGYDPDNYGKNETMKMINF